MSTAREQITEILWARDIDAFVAGDWSLVEPDFDHDSFCGHSGAGTAWTVSHPTLADYGEDWRRQARQFQGTDPAELRLRLRKITTITDVDVHGTRAVARKTFDGSVSGPSGEVRLAWITHYLLRLEGERWLITGFVGGLPLPGQDAPTML